uniref:Uncharacterized protein n=1 Tax=Glossina palpalis gambiensis TaxID=67801 RepID=A0A1B0B6E5_9MUSC
MFEILCEKQRVFKRLLTLEPVVLGIFASSLVTSSIIIPFTDCSNGLMRSDPPNPSLWHSDLFVRFTGEIFRLPNFVVVTLVAPSPACLSRGIKPTLLAFIFK